MVKNRKKEIIIIVCILLLLLLGLGGFFLMQSMNRKTTLTSEWDISWYDENEDEYVITTKEQLFGFSELSQTIDFAGKTIKLGNDIVVNEGNAEDWSKKVPELIWTPAINFAGTFDGQGYTLSGLFIDVAGGGAGLFADTKEDCVIKDFKLLNTYVYSQTSKGTGSVSSGGGGTFERIYSDAIIECNGFYCGGIIGTIRSETVMNECWFDGELTIEGSCAGGIAAALADGSAEMNHCLNTGLVNSTYPGPDAAILGGLCGAVSKTLVVRDSLNTGIVVSEEDLEQVGSLFGTCSGGTIRFDSVWTKKESASSALGLAKSGLDGIWGERTEKNLTGFLGYQKTDLDFDKYWAVVEDGTPILQYFAETVPQIPELERALVADVSWYNAQKKEYVIRTAEELLGLTRLTAKGYGNRFTDKTIKLGNDIVFNEGDAKDFAEEEPLNEWTPIYNYTGTFDGQGYTISGLYGSTLEGTTTGMALFSGTREMTVIQNLQVTNSYFTTVTAHGLAVISSRGTGTFKNIYVEAILVAKEQGSIGGILGMATKDGVTIENCWSDCDITSGGRRAGGILGNGNGKSKVSIKHCLNTGTLTRSFKELAADNKLRKQSSLFGGIIGGTGTGSKGDYKGDFTIEDCLNVGLLQSDRENDGLGGVAGTTTGNTFDGKATVTVKNCYCSETSCAKVIGGKNSETVVYDCVRLNDEMLIGAEAYFYTSLNFKEYWAALSGKTPILKTFASGKGKTVAVNGERSDISWYTPGKTEYTIKTAAQLYGLARLAFGGEKFEGVTIKLGADLVINTGNASEWVAGTAKAGRAWTPIKNFGGTFDGQGHTISGLYGIATGVHEDRVGMGLFVETRDTAVIQNVSIKNSYFESTYANGVGAVSGRGGGNFKNIYVGSDVYLQNKLCGSVGAIVGITTKTTTIENCWSAATITASGQGVGGIVGNGNAQTVTIKHCLNTGTITRSFEGMAEALASYDYAEYPSYYKDTTETAGYFGGIIGRTGGGKKGAYTGTFVIEDCLSVGTIVSDREKDAIGGIAGQTTGNKSDGTPTVTITNAYCTESSCTKVIASQNAETNLNDCVRMPDEMLVGADAYYYTGLNFDTYWAAITSETPVLKTFATTGVVAVSGTRSDISWYSKGEAIMNVEDLYGLVRLALSGETFKGETVKLGAKIEVNAGSASNWAASKNLPGRSWTPIQNFAGTFDGQGYSISGLYGVATGYHADRDGMGLFVETKDTATVQNLTVSNSYFESTYANGLAAVAGRGGGTFKNIHVGSDVVLLNKICGSVGGVLGMATKTSTIENCWSEAKITASGQGVGGIVGNGNAQTVTIRHCLNTGTLTRSFSGLEEALKLYDYADYGSYYKDTSESAGYFGGIIGRTGGGNSTSGYTGNFVIEDCMSAGTLTSERTEDANGGIAGQTTGLNKEEKATVTITNTYCTSSGSNKEIGSKNASTVLSDSKRLKDEYVTGENAYFYTALDYVGYWGIPREGTPILKTFAKASDNVIAYNGEWSDISWYNTNDINFTITDKADLYGLVRLSLSGETFEGKTITLNATESIVINEGDASKWADGTEALPENVWIPIQGFAGTFDGQNTTISGIYCKQVSETSVAGIGIFAETNGASIKNISLVNSYFMVNTSNGTGAITGQGSGTFENVHADVIMTDTSKKGYIGGIIGKATGPVNIENCWSEGDITSNYRQLGGIVADGNAQTVNIKHCLNTGDITISSGSTQTSCYTGGIIGKTGAGSASKGWTGSFVIDDCLSTGIVKTESESATGTLGSVVGYATGANGDVETVTISNTYGAVNYDENGQLVGVDKAIGSDYRATKTGCSAVTDSKLIGINAFYNTDLDFATTSNVDGYWQVRENAAPILVSFLTEDDEIVNVSGLNKTEFSLNENNEGFITNLTQLESFRDKMNDGTLNANSSTVITLTSDIVINENWTANATAPANKWTPVVGYPGTFDGDGHTISGLYVADVSGVTGSGLFTLTTATTVIQNLNVTNSYYKANTSGGNGTGVIVGQGAGTFKNIFVNVIIAESTKGRIGGIIGTANGDVTVSNCWNACDITSSAQYCGGILGNITNTGFNITIEHCLNTGNLSYTGSSNSYYGGLVGRANNTDGTTGLLKITDCLSVGIVKGTQKETYMGGLLGFGAKQSTTTTAQITNSYCAISSTQEGVSSVIGAYATNVVKTNCAAVDLDNLKGNSALTTASGLDYKSDSNTDGYWSTRENKIPTLTSFLELSNALDEEKAKRTFVLTDNKGTISNLSQLESFRDQMNAGRLNVNSTTEVKLTDDIIVNENWTASATTPDIIWTPIVGYPGTFDGDGHTISGLYVADVSGITGGGLFTLTTATTVIQNLNVTNSYYKANTSGGNGTGVIVGQGAGTFKNIYVNVIIAESTKGRIGGIIGTANGDVTVSNCWNACDITSSAQYCGGILGNITNTGFNITIEHCLNTGNLTYTGSGNSYYGGLVGRANNTDGTTGLLKITDCLSVGIVKGTQKETYMGGLLGFGAKQSTTTTAQITNSYCAISDTQEGVSSVIGAYATNVVKTNCAAVNLNDLKGNSALTTASGLDYKSDSNVDGFWSIRESAFPMLVDFLSIATQY